MLTLLYALILAQAIAVGWLLTAFALRLAKILKVGPGEMLWFLARAADVIRDVALNPKYSEIATGALFIEAARG